MDICLINNHFQISPLWHCLTATTAQENTGTN